MGILPAFFLFDFPLLQHTYFGMVF